MKYRLEEVHLGPVIDFGDSILENRQPKTSLENSLIIQKVIDAIYLSAQTGQAVVLRK